MHQQLFFRWLTLPVLVGTAFLPPAALASPRAESAVKPAERPSPQPGRSLQDSQVLPSGGLGLASSLVAQAAVEPFDPGCPAGQDLCAAWAEFRAPHPYPTQRIAVKAISDQEIALIISEPPSHFTKQQWQAIVSDIFASDLLDYQTFRWMIGVDGWVEDIALRLKRPAAPLDDLLSDRLTRDRIALLNIALFGSSLGAQVETIGARGGGADIARIPNLELSAAEVLAWATDQTLRWQTLGAPAYAVEHWLNPAAAGTTQTVIAADQTLVLLTFPASAIADARRTGTLNEALRIAFREFAVSSDVLLGGAWSGDQVAILGRARRVSTAAFPPLRGETFELIAAQTVAELQQSYERNHLFAGKLTTGPYAARDWAPIYLSAPLVNTEFGALLNITDQMLKSWSEAGEIEYLYFDYPHRPSTFPFQGVPISRIAFDQLGSQQVLFNWNTTGMGSIIAGERSVLVPTQTGALPITYGAELGQGGAIEMGYLQRYEEEAYDYFANLRDPGLATIAQYTLLYQLLLAAVPVTSPNLSPPAADSPILTRYALDLLAELEAAPPGDRASAQDSLQAFRTAHPAIDNRRLATLLVDPSRGQAQFFSSVGPQADRFSALAASSQEKIEQYNRLATDYRARQDRFNSDVDQFNATVNRLNSQGGGSASDRARLDQQRAALEAERQALNALADDLTRRQREIEQLEQQLATVDEAIDQSVSATNTLLGDVQQLSMRLRTVVDPDSLDPIRVAFSNAQAAAADRWIKTPASVLSWRNQGGAISLTSVGGHNLNSQALRFEATPGVDTLRVVEAGSGRVLQYNPRLEASVLANTDALTRAVEHGGIRDSQALVRLAPGPTALRPRPQALALDGAPALPLPPAIDGSRTSALEELVSLNDCCDFLADNILAMRNGSPPPAARIVGFSDTPSLYDALVSRAQSPALNRPIVVLEGQGRAEAIVRSLNRNLPQRGSASRDMGLLSDLADLINQPLAQGNPVATAITVIGYGRNNRLGSLRINLDGEAVSRSRIGQALDRLAARFRPPTSTVQEVANPAVELQLPPSWQDAAAQNNLAVIKFTYSEVGQPGAPTDVYISNAANDPSQTAAVRREMVDATNGVISAKTGQEEPIADTLIEIKEQIEDQIRPLSSQRVEMLLENGQDTYYITDHPQGDRD